MLFTQFNLEDAKKVWYEEAFEDGEELEEPLVNVERICEAVEKCGLDADPQEIYEELQNMAPVQ